LMFVLNPVGGTKKAKKVWDKCVLPILKLCGISYSLQCSNFLTKVTEYRGHAITIAHSLDISQYCGIVCLSGDGLIHETMNGLITREDYNDVKNKVSIGVIPCGSGNALAKSIGIENIPASIRAIVRGRSLDSSVMRIQKGEQCMYSIVGFLWALLADVDIESEKFRWMGSFRFTLQAIVRAFDIRRYRAKLWYTLESGDWKNVQSNSIPPSWKFLGIQSFVYFAAMNISHISSDFCVDPTQSLTENNLTLQFLNNTNTMTLLSLLTSTENSGHIPYLSMNEKVKAFYLEPIEKEMDSEKKLKKACYAPCGILSVDGESFPVSGCLVETIPCAIRIIQP
jgi:hypothetical protein